MSGVACPQIEAMRQGYSGNHLISPADGLADSVEISGNAACQFRGRLVKKEGFFGRNRCQDVLQTGGALFLLKALRHFHDANESPLDRNA